MQKCRLVVDLAVSPSQRFAWARSQKAAYKVLRSVELVELLPKSGSGKSPRRVLQEQEGARTNEA